MDALGAGLMTGIGTALSNRAEAKKAQEVADAEQAYWALKQSVLYSRQLGLEQTRFHNEKNLYDYKMTHPRAQTAGSGSGTGSEKRRWDVKTVGNFVDQNFTTFNEITGKRESLPNAAEYTYKVINRLGDGVAEGTIIDEVKFALAMGMMRDEMENEIIKPLTTGANAPTRQQIEEAVSHLAWRPEYDDPTYEGNDKAMATAWRVAPMSGKVAMLKEAFAQDASTPDGERDGEVGGEGNAGAGSPYDEAMANLSNMSRSSGQSLLSALQPDGERGMTIKERQRISEGTRTMPRMPRDGGGPSVVMPDPAEWHMDTMNVVGNALKSISLPELPDVDAVEVLKTAENALMSATERMGQAVMDALTPTDEQRTIQKEVVRRRDLEWAKRGHSNLLKEYQKIRASNEQLLDEIRQLGEAMRQRGHGERFSEGQRIQALHERVLKNKERMRRLQESLAGKAGLINKLHRPATDG